MCPHYTHTTIYAPYMQAALVGAPTSAAPLSSAPQFAHPSAPNSTIPHEQVGGESRSAPTTGGHVNGADKASLVSFRGRHTRVSSSGMCEQKKEAHRHRAWGGCHALLLRGGVVALCSYVGGGVSRSAPTTGEHVRCQSRALPSYPRSAGLRTC